MGKPRIIAAMSGGVDSSVAAALLVKEGYDVIGITMQTTPAGPKASESPYAHGCCTLGDVRDAAMVARKLDIPHYVLNFREVFNQKVIDNFTNEYLQGRTPNPCVRCNQHIKFAYLMDKARELSADAVATGHYARITRHGGTGRLLLHRGLDPRKDQSYVLHVMTQQQLRHTRFPLGGHTKDDTRALAAKLGLAVAGKRDSYEICFVPDKDYASFVAGRHPDQVTTGPIVDTDGRVLGSHDGIVHYTVGQRKGLGLAARHALYVLRVEAGTNTIVVGPEDELYQGECLADALNWIPFDRLDQPMDVQVKFRSMMPDVPGRVEPAGEGRVRVKFAAPQRAVTPGQSVVFYRGDLVLGGGTIL